MKIKLTIGMLFTAVMAVLAGQISYTPTQLDDAIRRSLDPAIVVITHTNVTPYVASNIVADTWTRLVPSGAVIKRAQDFGYGIISYPTDVRFQYQGANSTGMFVALMTDISSSVANNTVEFRMSRGQIGGTPDAFESGVTATSFCKNADQIYPAPAEGWFYCDSGDVLATWVRCSVGCDLTFNDISILIWEYDQ